MKGLNNKKAPSSGKINDKIVKYLDSNFPNLFSTIINKCLAHQFLPVYWKVANLKLLPEPGQDRSEERMKFLKKMGNFNTVFFIKRRLNREKE